jgi:hypothetical protein
MNAIRTIGLSFVFAGLSVLAVGAETTDPKDAMDAKETRENKGASQTKPVLSQVPPLSPRFKQVRDKITTLFEHRNEPPTPPDPRTNPFRPPGAAVVAAPPSTAPAASSDFPLSPAAEPEPPGSDFTRLQESVAALKFGGTLERGGHLYLMINGKPYKDNEVVQAQLQGETVYLRLRQISRTSVTVVLNDAELTKKF